MPRLGIAHSHTVHQHDDLLEPRTPDPQIALGRRTGLDFNTRGPFQKAGKGPNREGFDLLPAKELDTPRQDRKLGTDPGAHLDQEGVQRQRVDLSLSRRRAR